MANQLLAGVHIASAAEAMAFGARLGLNTRTLFDIITNSRGTSWYVLPLQCRMLLFVFDSFKCLCKFILRVEFKICTRKREKCTIREGLGFL